MLHNAAGLAELVRQLQAVAPHRRISGWKAEVPTLTVSVLAQRRLDEKSSGFQVNWQSAPPLTELVASISRSQNTG